MKRNNTQQQSISSKVPPSSPREFFKKNVIAILTQLIANERLKSNVFKPNKRILPQLPQYDIYVPRVNQTIFTNTFQEDTYEQQIDRLLQYVRSEHLSSLEMTWKYNFFRTHFSQLFSNKESELSLNDCIDGLKLYQLSNYETISISGPLCILNLQGSIVISESLDQQQTIQTSENILQLETKSSLGVQLLSNQQTAQITKVKQLNLQPLGCYFSDRSLNIEANIISSFFIVSEEYIEQCATKLERINLKTVNEFFHTLPIFHNLELDVLNMLGDSSVMFEEQNGHIICYQNQPITHFYIIYEGEVKLQQQITGHTTERDDTVSNVKQLHKLFKMKASRVLKDHHTLMKKGFIGLQEVLSAQKYSQYTATVVTQRTILIQVQSQVFLDIVNRQKNHIQILHKMLQELRVYEWSHHIQKSNHISSQLSEQYNSPSQSMSPPLMPFSYITNTLNKVSVNHIRSKKQIETDQLKQQERFRLQFFSKFVNNKHIKSPQLSPREIDPKDKFLKLVHLDEKYKVVQRQLKVKTEDSPQLEEIGLKIKTQLFINDEYPCSDQKIRLIPLLKSNANVINKHRIQKKNQIRQLKILE